MKFNFYSLRKFHGYLYEKKLDFKNRYDWWKYLSFPFGKKGYFIGAPEYENLGDSAIAIAETLFLENCGFAKGRIKEITQSEFSKETDAFDKHIKKKHLICGIGGGNLGNQWYDEELFRYSFIDRYINNPTVIFPQTVYFTDDEDGRKALEESRKHYNNHNNLTIVAREQKSFDLLNKYYEKPDKLLTPDIVLCSHSEDYGVKKADRSGALLVLRSDAEKSMTDKDRGKIVNKLENRKMAYRFTDMYSDCSVTKQNRRECVRKKMQEFASSELVVTDRLHGMVFSAITGTPCIVFSNYNHKVRGTYEWIKYLPYIKYAESADEIGELITELMSMKNCEYDNKPLMPYFDKLSEVVKQYVN